MSTYADKIGVIVNTTFVGFALTLSKDVGILQVLLDAQKPLTSHEIADTRDLKERYVRELLSCLATAEVIHVSTNVAGSLEYHIKEDEKKVFRTYVMAFITFPIGMMKMYDPLKSIFSNAGPNGMRIITEFHNGLEEFGCFHFDVHLDTIMKCVDGLKAKLESGIDVIEVGCGRGRLLGKIAQMFPQSTFTASDNVVSLLDNQKANHGHIPNITCEFIDLCCSPSDLPSKQYDWVHCLYVIHDVPNPLKALKTIRKLLKPGGTFTMIDMATSGSPIGDRGNLFVACIYAISTFACIPESSQQEDSHAVGPCWGKPKALELATAAGFDVKAVDIEYPITLFVCK